MIKVVKRNHEFKQLTEFNSYPGDIYVSRNETDIVLILPGNKGLNLLSTCPTPIPLSEYHAEYTKCDLELRVIYNK